MVKLCGSHLHELHWKLEAVQRRVIITCEQILAQPHKRQTGQTEEAEQLSEHFETTERLLDSLTNEDEKHFGPFIHPDRSVNANGHFTLLVTETFREVGNSAVCYVRVNSGYLYRELNFK